MFLFTERETCDVNRIARFCPPTSLTQRWRTVISINLDFLARKQHHGSFLKVIGGSTFFQDLVHHTDVASLWYLRWCKPYSNLKRQLKSWDAPYGVVRIFPRGFPSMGGTPKWMMGKNSFFNGFFYGAPPHLWNLPYVSIQTSRLYFLMSSWSWLILGMELFAHPAR
jgi:hypothetical protein